MDDGDDDFSFFNERQEEDVAGDFFDSQEDTLFILDFIKDSNILNNQSADEAVFQLFYADIIMERGLQGLGEVVFDFNGQVDVIEVNYPEGQGKQ
jgi:hypothetical protein